MRFSLGHVRFPDATSGEVHGDRKPNACPLCHVGIDPVFFGAAWTAGHHPAEGEPTRVATVFQCPTCREFFLAEYVSKPGSRRSTELKRTRPTNPESVAAPAQVAKMSPRFVRVLTEATHAASLGLEEIAGPGFRKALEILVKDYWTSKKPGEKKAILGEPLGATIKRFEKGDMAREAAEGAAWLGNDLTHYERRWIGKDLADMKAYLHLATHHIEALLATAELIAEKLAKPK